MSMLSLFQSTSSARRTTLPGLPSRRRRFYFNPRPPRGGRLSITDTSLLPYKFQSTSSARRTTRLAQGRWKQVQHFNPRPPRGGRHKVNRGYRAKREFQSTSSARRTTLFRYIRTKLMLFQSTSSARRTTAADVSGNKITPNFNPRPPRGGRLCRIVFIVGNLFYFNPRPPRGGRR